jgi:phage terminase small subunit
MELTSERSLREIARPAFFDPRKLLDAQGNPLPIQALDGDTAATVASLEVLEDWSSTGNDRVFIGYTKKHKVAAHSTRPCAIWASTRATTSG